MNLIINARDAMPEGGEIDGQHRSATIDWPGHDYALRVRVADHGVGIPADIIAKVTEPFFTTKETGKGTGLGLSMVAGFAQQSGGMLAIDSAPGTGHDDRPHPARDRGARGARASSASMATTAGSRASA